jgi:hypothetical protein
MHKIKLWHLLAEMKTDFALVAKAFNIDLGALVDDAVASGTWPDGAMWAIYGEIVTQKSTEVLPEGGRQVGRAIPFVSKNWEKDSVYTTDVTANDVRSLLRRAMISFGDPDKL